MSAKNLYLSVIAFASGILLRSFIDLGFSFVLLCGFVAGLLFVWFGYLSMTGRKSTAAFFLALTVFSFFIGVFRFDISDTDRRDLVLESAVGEQVVLRGIVSSEPKGKDTYRSIVIRAEDVSLDGVENSINEKILIFAPFYPEVSYGDRLEVTGKLQKPKSFQTERGDIFDYGAYLSKDDIFYQVFFPRISILSEGHGNFAIRNLLSLKSSFLEGVEKVMPEPHASLLGGILLGTEESLGEKLVDDFRRTGLIHIVVLSGYNVTIVADFVRAIFASFLPGLAAGGLGIVSIGIFAIIVGLGATVVRASIMAVLVIIARQTHRHYEVGRALLIAGAIMVFINPKIIAFDASFQLSFLATLGLVYVVPMLEPYFGWITERFGIREIILATLATQIFVLPFILYKIGLLSLVSLPVNLLSLPMVPIAMLFGFITGVLGFLPIISLPFAFITYFILEYVLRVVEFFGSLPFASVEVGTFSFLWVILIYATYAFLIWKFGDNKASKHKSKNESEAEKIASQIEMIEG